MVINEKALFDFMYCPLYFHTKHILKVPMDNSNTLNKCIIGAIKFFYIGLLNGQMRSYKQIQSKWDALAKTENLDNKQLITGWSKIVNIIEWSRSNQIIVADVGCNYNYSSTNHTVEGQIDFVLIYPNKEIELLYFDLGDRRLNDLEEHKKIKYALDFFGFERLYEKKPDRLKIYQPKYEETVAIHLNHSDQKRLTSIIQNTGECIKQKLYVPREGYMCTHCLAKSYCRYFSNE